MCSSLDKNMHSDIKELGLVLTFMCWYCLHKNVQEKEILPFILDVCWWLACLMCKVFFGSLPS